MQDLCVNGSRLQKALPNMTTKMLSERKLGTKSSTGPYIPYTSSLYGVVERETLSKAFSKSELDLTDLFIVAGFRGLSIIVSMSVMQ